MRLDATSAPWPEGNRVARPARPFRIELLEDARHGRTPREVAPHGRESWNLFHFDDPFGLQVAVVPLFALKAGRLDGLGTAFFTDPWGGLATADHVIEDHRRVAGVTATADGDFVSSLPLDEGFIAILGFGATFGQVGIPDEALARVVYARSSVYRGDDPLAALQGRPDYLPIDLAHLQIAPPGRKLARTLPMAAKPPIPNVGDYVLAVGYPESDRHAGLTPAETNVVTSNLKAAYGVVRALHLAGRDKLNRTPAFEVAAVWPSGLSGGPVLNADGEVIGVVSRSIEPEDPSRLGVGWAACLGALPFTHAWAPSLVAGHPDMRKGWVAMNRARQRAHFGTERDEVEAFMSQAEKGFEMFKALVDVRTGEMLVNTNERERN